MLIYIKQYGFKKYNKNALTTFISLCLSTLIFYIHKFEGPFPLPKELVYKCKFKKKKKEKKNQGSDAFKFPHTRDL